MIFRCSIYQTERVYFLRTKDVFKFSFDQGALWRGNITSALCSGGLWFESHCSQQQQEPQMGALLKASFWGLLGLIFGDLNFEN